MLCALRGGLGNRMFLLQVRHPPCQSHALIPEELTCLTLRSCPAGGAQSLLGIAAKYAGVPMVVRVDMELLREVFTANYSQWGLSESRVASAEYKMEHSTTPYTTYLESQSIGSLGEMSGNLWIGGWFQRMKYLLPLVPPRLHVLRGEKLYAQAFRPLLRSLWRIREEHVRAAQALLREHRVRLGVHYRVFPPSHLRTTNEGMPTVIEVQGAMDAALRELPAGACVMIFSNDPETALAQLSAPCMHAAPDVQFRTDPAAQRRPNANVNARNEGWATQNGRDLAALTMCEVLIITGGTFGLFAGLLHTGGGNVWAAASSRLSLQFDPSWRAYGHHARASANSSSTNANS